MNLKYQYIDATSTPFPIFPKEGEAPEWWVVDSDHSLTTGRKLIELRNDYDIDRDSYDSADELRALIVEHERENYPTEPMMNYGIVLDQYDDEQEMANKMTDSCFCVVALNDDDDTHMLALTGGGMDMTWQMVKAFVQAGYYPPAFICNLPAMAMTYNPILIDAANHTLETLADRYTDQIKRNSDLIDN